MFRFNLPPALLGGTGTELESADKVNFGEKNSPAAPAGIKTHNLSIASPALLPASYPGYSRCIQLVRDPYGLSREPMIVNLARNTVI